jgi:transcriptional regulator with XRE-family HTH domain
MASEPEPPLIGKLVGARIREARKARNFTQSQLAGKDFSVSYISAIERGQIHPSLRALEIFAQRLGLSSKDLLVASSEGEAALVGTVAERDREEADWQLLVAHILLLQRAFTGSIQLLQELVSKTSTASQKGRAFYLLALARARLDQWQESDHALSEAARLVKGPTSQLALRIRHLQGIVHAHIHTHAQGMELHQQSLERLEAQQLPDVFLKGEVFAQMGYLLLHLDSIDKASEMLAKALQQTQALAPSELADIYYELSRLEANEYFQAALYAYKSLYLSSNIAGQSRHRELHHMLGRTLLQGDRDQALAYLVNTAGEVPRDPLVQASALVHLALWELAGNNVAEAKNHANQAQSLLASSGDNIIAADALLAQGKVEYAQKRYKAGDAHFEAGLAMLERLEAREDLAEQFASYAQALENRGDFRRAIEYWKKAYETRRKMLR